jgi:hypothetical protein
MNSIRFCDDAQYIKLAASDELTIPSAVQLEVILCKSQSRTPTTMTLHAIPEDLELCPVLHLLLWMKKIRDLKSGALFLRPIIKQKRMEKASHIQWQQMPIDYRIWSRLYQAMFSGILDESGANCTAHGPRRTGAMTWLRHHGTQLMVHYGRWKGLHCSALYSVHQEVVEGMTPRLSSEMEDERDFAKPKAIFHNINSHGTR